MLPARVLTVTGKSGPASLAELEALQAAFAKVHGSYPDGLTVTAEALDRTCEVLGRDDSWWTAARVREQILYQSRHPVPWDDVQRLEGVVVQLGPAYTLWAGV